MRTTVVGAGIAGLATAWALTRRGHQVTLIEQGTIPNTLSASGDHHRIIRRAYPADSGYGDAISEAYSAWNELWRDLDRSHYDPRGFMCISREQGDEAEIYLAGMDAGGWQYDLLQPDAACERWPFLDRGSFRYAFQSDDGGALHCRRIASDLAAWLREHGCVILEQRRVDAVDCDAGRCHLADGATIAADQVVITAGAWVAKLFPDLSQRLAVHRTGVVYLDPPTDLVEAWSRAPVILDVGGATDGYIIPPSGQGGLKFGAGAHRYENADPDRAREPYEGEGWDILNLFAPPIARISEYEITHTATCVYTFTSDERFFMERRGNCVIVSACSGHGYKFGAAVGQHVAAALENGDFARLERWLLGDRP